MRPQHPTERDPRRTDKSTPGAVESGIAEEHPQNPSAVHRGSPGFHSPTDEEMERPGVTPASLQLDADVPGRVNTETGDQPGNMGGSRTGTPAVPISSSGQDHHEGGEVQQ